MTSNASPSGTPTPAPVAASLFDANEDVLRTEEGFETDSVVVAVTVTVTAFVLLGDVEPDVRLNITSPASMKKGDVLPLVATMQVSLDGSAGPQQNKGSIEELARFMPAPPPILTAIRTLVRDRQG